MQMRLPARLGFVRAGHYQPKPPRTQQLPLRISRLERQQQIPRTPRDGTRGSSQALGDGYSRRLE